MRVGELPVENFFTNHCVVLIAKMLDETCHLPYKLQQHVRQVLQEVVFTPLEKGGVISAAKMQKPRHVFLVNQNFPYTLNIFRMRASVLLERLTSQLAQTSSAELSSTSPTDPEMRRCAALIVTAYLNPSSHISLLLFWQIINHFLPQSRSHGITSAFLR